MSIIPKEEPKEETTLTTIHNEGIVDVDRALNEWKAYQTITTEMLDDSDYQDIKGKKFKKKSAWRKYMRAFNITSEIKEKIIIKTDKGIVKESEFTMRATLPDGRFADGWGNCSRSERGFNKPNHDIPATAMTRALNRAISDLIGAGEVSAEEMNNDTKKKMSDFQAANEVAAEFTTKKTDKKIG